MQSDSFEPFADACHAFGVDPTELLGITHSLDRTDILMACRLAAERVQSKAKSSEIKFAAEITALRIGHQIGRLWDGRDIPSMDEIFASEEKSQRRITENGKDYVYENGVRFEVV